MADAALGGHRWVIEFEILSDEVHNVHSKAVDAAIEPEPKSVVHRSFDIGVVPIEVGLLAQKAMQIPLAALLVVVPGR